MKLPKEHMYGLQGKRSVIPIGIQGNQTMLLQMLNTVYLNDKTVPTILSSSLDDFISTISVTFSEAVFATNSTSGVLTTGDFTLAISGGTGTLPSNYPTSISGDNGPVF